MKTLALTLATGLAVLAASLGTASCGGQSLQSGGPPSPSVGSPTLPGTVVTVPSNATQAQIDACVAKAVAAGAGTWVVFPAGTFAYSGTFVVPDYINIRGQGIWDQGSAGGSGGTWLQCTRGLRWGSYSTVKDLLVGQNAAGGTCYFSPVPRGSSAAGPFTQAHGSHSCRFDFVRFKGGSDSGTALIDLGNNFGSGLWSGTVRTYDMIDTNWYDCEFERPQGISGDARIMNIWLDCRVGGAQVYGNGWYRCHFGVKNGYHSGIDGYGIGQTIIFQPAPAEHASDGPRPTSGSNAVGDGTNGWNPSFDWAQVDHGFDDHEFTDCLFEYANWYPTDFCDYARSYSVWKGNHSGLPGTLTTALSAAANTATGWGNPPQAQWTNIPDEMWYTGLSMTRCYHKGSYPTGRSIVGEIVSGGLFTDCYSGTGSVFNYGGSFGNVVRGTFSNADRPVTTIFPAGSTHDWAGATTSYTSSPYDP